MDGAHNFPHPQHNRRATDYNEPIGDFQRHDIEKLAAQFHNENLTEEYYRGYHQKSTAVFEMER